MTLPAFDEGALVARLTDLDEPRQLVFGALCCERLLPNYLVFSQEQEWGVMARLRQGLDRVWQHIGGVALDAREAVMLCDEVEAVVPDSENFDSLYVTAAQDACLAVCALYDFIVEPDTQHIADVARFATDSVDLYVQEIEQMPAVTRDLEYMITEHRLMQRELRQQVQDLDALTATPIFDRSVLEVLRAAWPQPGRSNLDLP